MRDATAVVVNYNSGERLARLLGTLDGEVGATIVVDNASSDGSPDSASRRDSVQVLRNERNRGFAAAANQGAALATTTWLVFINPDVGLPVGCLAALLEGIPETTGAVAPLQVDARGRPLHETGGYDPSLPRFALWAICPTRFNGRLGPWLAPPYPNRDIALDWVSGAMLAIRRELFEVLGGFDERFFLHQEDTDLGKRVRAAGYRVVCRGSVRVRHEVAQGDPVRKAAGARRFVESLGIQFSGWRRCALGMVLLFGYGLRSVVGSRATRAASRAALYPALSLARTADARRG